MENSFGDYLRQQRESREISLEQLSAKTKIKKNLLSALENDQYEQLPGLVFIRGFIRAYAQEVGLNPEEALQRFEEYLKETKPVLSGPKSAPIPQKHKIIPYVLVSVFALALVGLAISLLWSFKQNETSLTLPSTPSTAKTLSPIPSNTTTLNQAPSAPSITPPFHLSIKATELCWLLATIDGKESKEAMLYAGDSFEIVAKEKLSLLIGNAGGVDVTLNGLKLKPIGAHWKPMRLLIPEELDKYLSEKIEKTQTEPQKPLPEKHEPKKPEPEKTKSETETSPTEADDKKPQ